MQNNNNNISRLREVATMSREWMNKERREKKKHKTGLAYDIFAY